MANGGDFTALAGALNLNVYVINLTAPALTDENLGDLLAEAPGMPVRMGLSPFQPWLLWNSLCGGGGLSIDAHGPRALP